jgi:hypothetical protein
MDFSLALRETMDAVNTGDLGAVMLRVDALHQNIMRPVLESAVCIGFVAGASFEILQWMSERVGISVTRTPYGTRLKKRARA